MKFNDANSVQSCTYYMKLADFPRAGNRARVDRLFNGFPPFTPEEVVQNRIQTNVNDMTATRAAHAMRKQYSNAFLKPGNFFNVRLDRGPQHRRREWSQIITEEINRAMKKGRSAPAYQETLRNTFGQVVLHGVGPVAWADKYKWCPRMHGMEDVMIPSMTYRDMSNLSHFAIYKRYTAAELFRMTHGPRVDKAWNMKMVNGAIQWALQQQGQTISTVDALYSPERWEEAIKANTGLYASDQIPTINVWDFYYLSDDEKEQGWRRRMVLDCPDKSVAGYSEGKNILSKTMGAEANQFLYNPGNRNYADKLSEILHFQFADGSVVAPFLYHTIRSLGQLLYSVCHIQSRIYSKVHDNAFESLMQYFRIQGDPNGEIATKIDLIPFGIIPDGVQMVPRADRWQTDVNLVNLVMSTNRNLVADSSAAYNQDFGVMGEGPEKTATEINAQMQTATSMVGQMLQDAYGYAEYQYAEIARRFCIADSKDPDVRKFRVNVLKRGVPVGYLDSECWQIAADRVIGAGNKQIEAGMVGQLMQLYPMLDPDGQRIVKRLAVFSATDDASLTDEIVPDTQPTATESTHDAELSSTVLMDGIPMQLKQGVSHSEYAATLIGILGVQVKKIMQAGGTSDPDTIAGLENLGGMTSEGEPIPGNGAQNHLDVLAQDETAAETVKQLGDLLGKQMNEVRGIKQRTEEAMQQPQGEQPGLTPEDAVKLKSQLMLAQAKAENMRVSHEQRSQQRQEIHDQQMRERAQTQALTDADQLQQTQVDIAAKDLETAASIEREKNKPQPAADKSA
jgi:hypothetical protein